jgi:hypothetical protein
MTLTHVSKDFFGVRNHSSIRWDGVGEYDSLYTYVGEDSF